MSEHRRNIQRIRQWRIIGMLACGKAHKVQDFAGIAKAFEVSEKTIKRDLEALLDVPEFQIVSYRRDGSTFYRMDGRPWRQVEPVAKICNKCNKLRQPDEYYKNRETVDGLRSICLYCLRDYNKEWEKNNRARRNAYARRQRKLRRDEINERRRQVYSQRKSSDELSQYS